MQSRDVFEVCLGRYKECRAQLDLGKITAINPAACAKTEPRNDAPRVLEYVIDFELAGKEALGVLPRWAPRLKLFQIYYCQGFPYVEAIKIVGVRPGTFDYWAQEVKKIVGKELRTRGIFPPSAYFREPTKLRQERQHDARVNPIR